MEHKIPVMDGNQPVHLPPHWLRWEKEAEVKTQVHDLLKKGMIGRVGVAWSSPVELVKKKYGKWQCCVDCRFLDVAA